APVLALVPRTAPPWVVTTGAAFVVAAPARAAVAPAAVRVRAASAKPQAAARRARCRGAGCTITAAPSVEGKGLTSPSPAHRAGPPSSPHGSPPVRSPAPPREGPVLGAGPAAGHRVPGARPRAYRDVMPAPRTPAFRGRDRERQTL